MQLIFVCLLFYLATLLNSKCVFFVCEIFRFLPMRSYHLQTDRFITSFNLMSFIYFSCLMPLPRTSVLCGEWKWASWPFPDGSTPWRAAVETRGCLRAGLERPHACFLCVRAGDLGWPLRTRGFNGVWASLLLVSYWSHSMFWPCSQPRRRSLLPHGCLS